MVEGPSQHLSLWDWLSGWANCPQNLRLIETMKLDELPYSIQFPRGVVQMAMEMLRSQSTDVSSCWGLAGPATLSRLLGNGRPTMLLQEGGYRPHNRTEFNPRSFYKLDNNYDIEIIFNLFLVLVLTEEILRKVSPEAVIIDLASAPGPDFRAAEVLGSSSFGAGASRQGRTRTAGSDLGLFRGFCFIMGDS